MFIIFAGATHLRNVDVAEIGLRDPDKAMQSDIGKESVRRIRQIGTAGQGTAAPFDFRKLRPVKRRGVTAQFAALTHSAFQALSLLDLNTKPKLSAGARFF